MSTQEEIQKRGRLGLGVGMWLRLGLQGYRQGVSMLQNYNFTTFVLLIQELYQHDDISLSKKDRAKLSFADGHLQLFLRQDELNRSPCYGAEMF